MSSDYVYEELKKKRPQIWLGGSIWKGMERVKERDSDVIMLAI